MCGQLTTNVIPFRDPHLDRNFKRIRAVMFVYYDLYDSFEEGTTVRRKLETHEALFLSAVEGIGRRHSQERLEAEREWATDPQAFAAIKSLSYSSEADAMEAALRSYRNECERREFDNQLDEVSQQIAAE